MEGMDTRFSKSLLYARSWYSMCFSAASRGVPVQAMHLHAYFLVCIFLTRCTYMLIVSQCSLTLLSAATWSLSHVTSSR
jgi:hypothetical protein